MSIDVDEVVEDRRRFASCPQNRFSHTSDLGASRVTILLTRRLMLEDHCIGYPLPDGTVCDGRPPVPLVLLESCENIMTRSVVFFPGNVEITRNERKCWYCESDGLQFSKRYLENDQRASN